MNEETRYIERRKALLAAIEVIADDDDTGVQYWLKLIEWYDDAVIDYINILKAHEQVETKPLPCPQCDGKKLSIKHFSEVFAVAGFEYAYNNNFVYCNDCGLGFMVCEKEPKYEDDTHQALSMSKAVDMWNTRMAFIESQGV